MSTESIVECPAPAVPKGWHPIAAIWDGRPYGPSTGTTNYDVSRTSDARVQNV